MKSTQGGPGSHGEPPKEAAEIGGRAGTAPRCVDHGPGCACASPGADRPEPGRGDSGERPPEAGSARFPVQTRSALAVAHTLLEQGRYTEDELRAKMENARSRLARE